MLQRVRQFFHDSDVTVGVVAGVVGGLALVQLIRSAVGDFFVPAFTNAFGTCVNPPQGFFASGCGASGKALHFNFFGATIAWGTALADFVTLLIIVGIAYAVFIRVRGPSDEQALRTRECPECKSEIWSDARRCRFCTSAVEPVEAGAAPEAQ